MIAPLHIANDDLKSGAGRAAHRIHRGMIDAGAASRMLVRFRHSDDTTVVRCPLPGRLIDQVLAMAEQRLPQMYRRRQLDLQWGTGLLPSVVGHHVRGLRPDLVHLHWVSAGLISSGGLHALGRPVVWTLHDMWPLTGGCHYDQSCGRFIQGCGQCPQLGSRRQQDLSRLGYLGKARGYARTPLTVVALSSWMAGLARSSPLLAGARVVQIPNGLDLSVYRPLPRQAAREILDLPQDRPLILFGAMRSTSDRRKGYHLLLEALRTLRAQLPADVQPLLVTFGAPASGEEVIGGFAVRSLGQLNEDLSLALLYSAADLFVAPSVQDNLPNTVLEAAACGLPCVAFRLGGLPDLIQHRVTGYLADPLSTADLATGMAWLLAEPELRQQIGAAARRHVQDTFELGLVVRRYQELYREVLANG